MTNEELLSKTINFLRFPLIVGVVLIHAHITEVVINGVDLLQGNTFLIYNIGSYLFSEIIARMAVPLFFFISGFLFFYQSEVFSLSVYLHKLRKRVNSILVPYLFWNLATILLFFFTQSFISSLTSGANKLIRDYSFSDWIAAVTIFPINYQFWFLRDLMIVILLSPLVYLIVRYFRWVGILILGILWYLGWWFTLPGFSIVAFFFFSFGAYFSLWRCNFVTLLKPYLLLSIVAYFILSFVCVCYRKQAWISFIYPLDILIGIVFAISLSTYFLERGKWSVSSFLVGATFFVYSFHTMPLALIQKISIKYFPNLNDGILLSIYLLNTVFVILIGLGIYYLFRKWFPYFLNVITGGRLKR